MEKKERIEASVLEIELGLGLKDFPVRLSDWLQKGKRNARFYLFIISFIPTFIRSVVFFLWSTSFFVYVLFIFCAIQGIKRWNQMGRRKLKVECSKFGSYPGNIFFSTLKVQHSFYFKMQMDSYAVYLRKFVFFFFQ